MNIFETISKISKISGTNSSGLSRSERTYKALTIKEGLNQKNFLYQIRELFTNLRQGYWFGSEIETEDSIMLEFISTRAPTIRVFVDKKEMSNYSKENIHGSE